MKRFFYNLFVIGSFCFSLNSAEHFSTESYKDLWSMIILSVAHIKDAYATNETSTEKTKTLFRFLYPCIHENIRPLLCVDRSSNQAGKDIKTTIETYLQNQYIEIQTFFDCAARAQPPLIINKCSAIKIKSFFPLLFNNATTSITFYLKKQAPTCIILQMHLIISKFKPSDNIFLAAAINGSRTAKATTTDIQHLFLNRRDNSFTTFLTHFKIGTDEIHLNQKGKIKDSLITKNVEIMLAEEIDYTFVKTYFEEKLYL
jgi:hypothetical protein